MPVAPGFITSRKKNAGMNLLHMFILLENPR
jgi:hypothetical protein